MVERAPTEQVREPLQAVGDVRRDDLGHVALLGEVHARRLELAAQQAMRLLGGSTSSGGASGCWTRWLSKRPRLNVA